MTIAERRQELAGAITDALDDITVVSYRPDAPEPFTGWLEIGQIDTEDATYGEVRLSMECLILVAANRTDFEKVQDVLAVSLISAVQAAAGRAVVVQPYTEAVQSTTFYCLSAKFLTEALTESETA